VAAPKPPPVGGSSLVDNTGDPLEEHIEQTHKGGDEHHEADPYERAPAGSEVHGGTIRRAVGERAPGSPAHAGLSASDAASVLVAAPKPPPVGGSSLADNTGDPLEEHIEQTHKEGDEHHEAHAGEEPEADIGQPKTGAAGQEAAGKTKTKTGVEKSHELSARNLPRSVKLKLGSAVLAIGIMLSFCCAFTCFTIISPFITKTAPPPDWSIGSPGEGGPLGVNALTTDTVAAAAAPHQAGEVGGGPQLPFQPAGAMAGVGGGADGGAEGDSGSDSGHDLDGGPEFGASSGDCAGGLHNSWFSPAPDAPGAASAAAAPAADQHVVAGAAQAQHGDARAGPAPGLETSH